MPEVQTQSFLGSTTNTYFLGDNQVILNPFEQPPIPLDGLVAWYDGSNLASYPGSGSTWYDISPSTGSGTLVGSPTFNSTTKLFTFNGSSQRVDLTQIYPAGQSTYTYYCVVSAATGGTTQVFGQATESNNRRALMIRFGTGYGFNGYNNDVNQPAGMGVANNLLKGVALSMNTAGGSNAARFYLNGTFIVAGNTSNLAANLNMGTTARIASNAGNTELFNGSIGVCIAYNRVLTDAEIAQINTYYATKYTLV